MKRILRNAMAAIAVITLFACNNLKETAESALNFERELVFTASREGVSPDTKVVRMDDGSTWWNASEEISVFYGGGTKGGKKFVSQNTALQETVEFSGSITLSGSGKEFWAVYPYSVDNACDGSSITTVISDYQLGSEGNFSGDVFPAIVNAKSMDFAFWNICGGIKFFVSRSDIKSVTFKGNNDEILAGKVKVAFNDARKPVVSEVLDGKTEVTLTAPGDGFFKAGKYYYITLLPADLNSGFTMTFNTEYSKGVVSSSLAQTIKRSIFGVLKNVDSKVTEWGKPKVEPEAVDLGLPSGLKWATFNVGATKPEEYGDYFAWGEVEPYYEDGYAQSDKTVWREGKKSGYYWYSYKWCNSSVTAFSRYCPSDMTNYWDGSDSPDNKTVLDLEDDAARANWGGCWRMPTYAEWLEIVDNCTWTWTTENGVYGRLVTGLNSNSIFLPASGTRYDVNLYHIGSNGNYWSSSLNTNRDRPTSAYTVFFSSDHVYWYDSGRYYGLSVRPVYDDRIRPESVKLNKSSISLYVSESEQLTAKISPANATDKRVTWLSDKTDVATVDEYGNVTAIAAGSSIITATTTLGAKTATCIVTVVEKPQAVDLGLPSGVKWATCNVGALKPEEYGDYFAWGETEPISECSWLAYKWCNGNYNELTKYCTDSSYWGSTDPMDNKATLDLEDDAARANWGGSWRMPTYAEWKEICDNCTWTWTTENGVLGQTVTGPNGNIIFIPAVGYWGDTGPDFVGSKGNYWSSSLNMEYPYNACGVYFYSDNVYVLGAVPRLRGQAVRPVYDDRIHPESITLNKYSTSLFVGDSQQLIATISPADATNLSVTWSSDNKFVVNVDRYGKITALSAGFAVITATTTLGAKTAACGVMVYNKPLAVDLGLPSGLKWAAWDVGASAPEERGDYFAWGETQPKENYNWSTYKWCKGNNSSLTKYNTDSIDGSVDNKTVLDLEDDAARANWGGSWRMPTHEEWTELLNNCTWTWTTLNGVYGRLVTSKTNSNSIFLRAAGLWNDTNLYRFDSCGFFWSSSLLPDDPRYACFVYFASDNVVGNVYHRYYGFPVRPVTE